MEFEEKQRLNLWWLYLIIGMEAVVISSILIFDKGGINLNQLKEVYFLPIWVMLIPFLIVYLINTVSFKYQINEINLSYSPWPFGKNNIIQWGQIQAIYLRRFDALGEYGGWGVKSRLWFKLDDKAYIFNDKNVGLQVELKNGKKILFSTNKADELQLFLINLKTRTHKEAIETDVR